MYFLQKKITASSTDQPSQFYPRLTQRLDMKINNQLKKIINSNKRQKQNILTQKPQKYQLTKKLPLKNAKIKFNFLDENTQLMNRTLNTFTLRSNNMNVSAYKLELLAHAKNKQVKYDKTKKEDWMATHKRVATNMTKFNDIQQRKMYRSRKKYFENSLSTFSPMEEKTNCFEGIFPKSRLNSTMNTLFDKSTGKQRLFLIGGLSSEMSTRLHFHEYSLSSCLWQKVKGEHGSSPQFNLSQHIVLSYQTMLFVIGGIAVFTSTSQSKNQRYNIPFISCFNLKTLKWSRINWNVYLRAHAGSVFGHYGIIDGGISQDDKMSNKVYVCDLTKLQSPVLVHSNGLGLSHHKIISTEVFQDKSRSVLKFDGLLCFGGKKQNGQLNKNLYLMNYDSKHTELADKFNKFEWSSIQTVGKSPQARYMHSMDLLQTKSSIFERKAYCAILGGIDSNENVLNDFWLFDLTTLEWSQIILAHSDCFVLQNGIAGHCTSSTKNQIFVFGGFNCDRFNISKFWTINCQNNFRIAKKQIKINRQKQ